MWTGTDKIYVNADVVLATRPGAHPTAAFHILFVLGIVLAMAVFAHSLAGTLGEISQGSHVRSVRAGASTTNPNSELPAGAIISVTVIMTTRIGKLLLKCPSMKQSLQSSCPHHQ